VHFFPGGCGRRLFMGTQERRDVRLTPGHCRPSMGHHIACMLKPRHELRCGVYVCKGHGGIARGHALRVELDHHIVSPRRGSDDGGADALAAGRSSKHGEADGQRGARQRWTRRRGARRRGARRRLFARPGPSAGGGRFPWRGRHASAALLLAQLPGKACVLRCQPRAAHRQLPLGLGARALARIGHAKFATWRGCLRECSCTSKAGFMCHGFKFGDSSRRNTVTGKIKKLKTTNQILVFATNTCK
jgi:hypothetical protein